MTSSSIGSAAGSTNPRLAATAETAERRRPATSSRGRAAASARSTSVMPAASRANSLRVKDTREARGKSDTTARRCSRAIPKTRSAPATWPSNRYRARWSEGSAPKRLTRASACAGIPCPSCAMVPALSTRTSDNPARSNPARRYCSAIGERQMLPVQTVSTRNRDEVGVRSKLNAMLTAISPASSASRWASRSVRRSCPGPCRSKRRSCRSHRHQAPWSGASS